MENLKPKPVITSRMAKDHIFQARTYLSNMQNGILMQRQRIEQAKAQANQMMYEQQKVQEQNLHEQTMQTMSRPI
jgi:hypothetical protein